RRGRLLRRPEELDALRPQRLAGDPPGGGHRLLRLHRVRRDLHRGRGDQDPPKNKPPGIPGSLALCTVVLAVVGIVATGLVPYPQLKGSAPLAKAFEVAGITWGQAIISLGAIISMSAVLLVFQLGQPRIFFSMSRDGLLPPWFRKVHPRFHT